MSLKPVNALAQTGDHGHQSRERRCYVTAQILDRLQLSRSSFFQLKKAGQLPFVQELEPRVGRCARYRADLIDRYLAGQWGGPRAFRRSA